MGVIIFNKFRSASKTIEGSALSLQRVDHVQRCHGLPLGVTESFITCSKKPFSTMRASS